MFFVGILGIESKEKELRTFPNLICKACGRVTAYRLVKAYKYFHIFFIPIYRWDFRYYLISKCCGSVFEISNEQGKDLEEGKDYMLDRLKLTILEDNSCSGNIVCFNCGKEVSSEFEFCPHCGARLK